MAVHFSRSEENGLKAIPDGALTIYSVGVSTAGTAEIRMAKPNPDRTIIATTIDAEGAEFTKKYVKDQGFSKQVSVKIEDVTEHLPYPDNTFDFEYARLVLHYLPKSGLMRALASLYRVLKSGGKIFIVVRSVKTDNFTNPTSIHDTATGITTFQSKSDPAIIKKRFFQTPESISDFVTKAGFKVDYVKEYTEVIYTDFKREGRPSDEPLIELLAVKP